MVKWKECTQKAAYFALTKSFGAKFVRLTIESYYGKGGGIQYIGIDMAKGIDKGIRSKQTQILLLN